MAMLRHSTALVRTPNISGSGWATRSAATKGKQSAISQQIISKYSPSKWLLSHVSIVASVDTSLADPKDKKSNWLIKPEHSLFVNNNGDCWERELLIKTYKTFLGANNYVEHVQIPELSKGKVIDVALREVNLGKDSEGNPDNTLYVDLLIATDRKHSQLCKQIEDGEYNAVSMGCLIQYSICSRCGNKAADETEACEHVRFYKGNDFYDQNGVKRVIAELCGHKDDPSSVKFIDASWVKNPAFPGAVLRNIVSPPRGVESSVDELMKTLSGNKEIPKDEHHTIAKKASVLDLASRVAAGEGVPDDSAFPEMSEGDEPVDTSPESEEPAADEGGEPPADGEESGEGGGEPGATPEEAEKTPLKEIADQMKSTLTTQVKQDMIDELRGMSGIGTGEGAGRGGANPYVLENESNDSFVKESSREGSLYLWNKYSIDLSSVHNKRMASMLVAASCAKTVKDFVKKGFSRADMLDVLAFVDVKTTGSTLGQDSMDFLRTNKIASRSAQQFFKAYIIEAGRVPGKGEGRKLWAWAQTLEEA